MRKSWQILLMFIVIFTGINGMNVSALSNAPIHWGFKKARNEVPPDAGETYEALLNEYGAFYKGNPESKVVYLTFDNGYENGFTEKILDVLNKEQVPATFFVTGHYLESAPELAKRMVREGHIIGNHSWSHPDLTQISDEQIKEELQRVKEKTYELTGQKEMIFLRPPRGIFSERTLKIARDEGYFHVFWSLAFVDWYVDRQLGWQYAYGEIMEQVHPGAIILLHTVSKDNADALEKVIQDLKNRGYRFASLYDLLLERELGEQSRFFQ